MQVLAGIIQEYDNQGPSIPEVYILDIINKQVIPSSMKEVQKLSNLIYDMGGGETSYYDEYNVVIVDNMDENEVLEGISDGKQKLYIKYNLENPISLPKANKIIASQLVYHLDNIENFAKTVNDSLKPNGIFEFFSDIMSKDDKQFLQILVEQYNFFLPDNISLKSLSKYKGKILPLRRNKPFITPKIEARKEWVYDIVTKEGEAQVRYKMDPDNSNVALAEKISGTIPDIYFTQPFGDKLYPLRVLVKGLEPWDLEKGPFPYYANPNARMQVLQPWDIISFKRVK